MDIIWPNSWLGLMGGGQLGRMFAISAQRLGYKVMVVDPNQTAPATSVANFHLCADYNDKKALKQLAKKCQAVTTEFENVPAESLDLLSRDVIVSPGHKAVEICQDRILEKSFLKNNSFKTTQFKIINTIHDFPDQASGRHFFPGFLKVSRFGYDGKGQIKVCNISTLKDAFKKFDECPCVLEEGLELEKEISVILVRSDQGNIASYPVVENTHKNGILDFSVVPADLPVETIKEAKEVAVDIAKSLQYVGVMCVEFFLHKQRGLLVNEIAPRPHNSGHFTLDACFVSQFEQQVRSLCKLPLGSTAIKSPSAVMVNLLGNLWQNGDPNWSGLLESGNTSLHLYGKDTPANGRKMGHYTVLAKESRKAKEIAFQLKKSLA